MLRNVALGTAAVASIAAVGRRALGMARERQHRSDREDSYKGASTRILILGGGFGGLSTALELEKRLGDRDDVSVLVIDRDNSTLFTPLLWPVANGTTNPNAVVVPLRAFQKQRRFHILHARIERIDLDDRMVYVRDADARPYDFLVIALGSMTEVPDLPGLRERALLFSTPADALQLRNRLVDAIEMAHRMVDPADRQAWLTFVVGGGGDTGVEVAATIHDYLESGLLAEYPWLAEERFRVVVVGRADRLVPAHNQKTSDAVRRSLEGKGIEVWTGASLTSLTNETVHTSAGNIAAHTMFWAAGISAPPIVSELPVEHARNGAVLVDDRMRVPERPEVYCIGDSSWGYDPDTGDPLPPTAQAAEQQGRYVARSIAATVGGEEASTYVFSPRGTLVLLGRHSGVAEIGPITLRPRPPFVTLGKRRGLRLGPVIVTGFPAWLMWHGYYLAHIPAWRNRVHLLTNWLLAATTGRETSQLRLGSRIPGER